MQVEPVLDPLTAAPRTLDSRAPQLLLGAGRPVGVGREVVGLSCGRVTISPEIFEDKKI